MTEPTIRPGVAADAGLLLAMFDGAVAWLTERGREGQWGSTPWSEDPKRVERVNGMASGGKLLIAEFDGDAAGALILTEQPPAHIPPVSERELYIDLLITARRHTGRGVGAFLLRHAREEARRRSIGLVRVDCWAGGDGALVRYYTGQGFTPTERFRVGDWVGQVFEDRLDGAGVG
ncbi:GNAT family N-acetyltransferase [Prauserella sp. PE36]|uniref:GNAT family N-acetyltransferase n=1 Tax=Prauserella endophytica TaxID=1592324 RepID=A0ABY2RWX9_9PSEU|nr:MULTISPECIES: GNAT family N-acetyltransferase [Prauserella]PXY26689.1 GCN5 family acetyltransferase [Prauserella coralliicola]RBM16511.1 GNAT family N-acetyltransferase [Prauserella sp. PE36]TKG63814.1 GNAT family N-acetyltransferase [Prauserella endophytica]